ncbi:MAG TPA: glycosyl hydrolase family 18 protein [Cytophagaceae bacterium]
MNRLIICSFLCALTTSLFAQNNYYCTKVAGYIPNYRTSSNVDYSKLTHAFFAFAIPTPEGGITPFQSWENNYFKYFKQQCEQHGVKKIISIGSTNFPAMANDAAARKKFADTITKFCLYHSLDGVDIDWEGLQSSQERTNYQLVMEELHASLKAENLLLISTVFYGHYWGQWFPTEGLMLADWLQIMIYDQTGTWNTSPFGNHSSFQHFKDAETYWVGRGFEKSKLVMGLPFYGYKFNSTSGGLATAYTYNTIVEKFPDMLPSDNQTPGDDLTVFNGPDLIRQKVAYAVENRFAGVMVWEMTQDAHGANASKSLHKVIIDQLESSCNQIASVKERSMEHWSLTRIENQSLIIDVPYTSRSILVTISDLTGKVVFQKTYNNISAVIDIPDTELTKGLLIVNVGLDYDVFVGKVLIP